MPLDFDALAAQEDDRKRDLEKRAKKVLGGAGGREEEQSVFNAVEFRKKEMVFQPRKKTTTLTKSVQKTVITQPKAGKRIVKVYGSMKMSALADEIGVKAPQLMKALMANGVTANMNTSLDFDTIALIVPEFGWEAQNIKKTDLDLVGEFAFGDLQAKLVPRPAVVAVMGHVDHGKTSLLDAIRKADVASGEAGGITQHIGAYSVELEDHSRITFLDTPGHEAFTAMRARGANVTDIAVIVVAADDGVMPQTAEAINHAKAASVPLIVAVNKIDKPGAQVDKIKQQLTEYEVVPEEWGGTTIFCEVSALKKTGIKELLEQIQLVAEVQELRANPLRSGTGSVIEAKVEKGKGSVATLLVKDGSVKVGQIIVAGTSRGRIRSLMNDKGERVKEALPGFPVEVQGLESTPLAGDRFDIVKDEKAAEELIQVRREQKMSSEQGTGKLSLEQIFAKATQGDVKELPIVLKADVQGSVEAISGMLKKLESDLVKTKIIHAAVGPISESDVLLAQTAKGLVIGFNVRPDTGAQAKAKQMEIEIRTYSIVYELIDDMKKALSGLLSPDIVEKVLGRVEVRNIFSVPKVGTIAGCFVIDGKVLRSAQARLLRDGKIIYEGKISSLKRFKDDAKEVASGFECGIGIENFNDIKPGDAIEIFIKEEVAKVLELNG
jgi:translation initiation factor IF-2